MIQKSMSMITFVFYVFYIKISFLLVFLSILKTEMYYLYTINFI